MAALERAATPGEVTPELAERVASSLRERHAPVQADYGLVTYDGAADGAVGTVSGPTVGVLLANNPRTRLPWYKVYLLVTAVSTGLLALIRFDVAPFDVIGPTAAAALVVALFAATSLAHWYDVYRWRRATEDTPPDFAVTLDEEVTYRETLDDLERETSEDEFETDASVRDESREDASDESRENADDETSDDVNGDDDRGP
ncbi:hypothetical protein M0R88_00190 [Halorussus gelatinilyticus]|uniref:Uncharacterized protein n=1 Tax=Halorussus gelatinilyticus TaxID=2937524 RepID=A0A8U0IKG1_9EURY|nr:hypothetical protein [Halorussus gelatinilyticus]UPW00539.1 hypothetical protein M0R88_00190 [Halorussus gelatinilyticus]